MQNSLGCKVTLTIKILNSRVVIQCPVSLHSFFVKSKYNSEQLFCLSQSYMIKAMEYVIGI